MKTGRGEDTRFEPVMKGGIRAGFLVRLVLLIVILGVLASLAYQYRAMLHEDFLMAALGIFAVLGVFFVVGLLLGLIRLLPSDRKDYIARAFLDQYPEAVLLTDHRGKPIYANRAYSALTDRDPGAALADLNTLLSGESEGAEVIYRLSQMVRQGQNGQEEFRLSGPVSGKADGTAHWYRLKARFFPVEDIARRRSNLNVWQISDVTEERRDQERYFNELQKAIDYLDHAPVGFMTIDGDGKLRYLNATLSEWLDFDLAAFVPGEALLEDIVAQEAVAVITAIDPEPGQHVSETIDVNLKQRSGRYVAAHMLLDVSRSRDGGLAECRAVVLRRDSVAVAADHVEQNRFFDDTPMAIATVDRDGRILTTNTRFMAMFSGLVGHDEIGQGARIAAVMAETDRSRMRDALDAALDRQGEIAPFEARHAKDDGRHFRFFVHAANSDEGQAAALVYAIDISEQKALEAQMARTQKLNAVGTLAGGIAHDFNNVLTAILLSADHLLLQSRASDPEFADLVEIKRNANRASLLVRQLLAFSRQQTMRPEVVDLTDVVGEMRMMIERLTGGSDVKLKTEFARDLWPVKTDPAQFGQVITNLCVNARDAMPNGGTLTVRTANVPAEKVASLGIREVPEADFVMVEVEDTGTGIPPELLDKIFEPFFTTKDVGKGTGLGLAMVYGIVTQSGGYLHPVSEVGKGTKFVILLPRHMHKPVAGEHVTGPTDHKGQPISAAFGEANQGDNDAPREEDMDLTGRSVSILLVEDEDAVRRSGKRMLEMRGFTVHEADTGLQALQILRSLDGVVDIVVSDVVMPEMDGPTLLREARQSYPELKFIFVSGYADDAFAKNLPEDAKFGFLPKPYNLKQLVAAVWEMLRDG